MIKLGSKNIIPQNFIKVTKGDEVVWESNMFKEIDIYGFGATTINDGGEYEVPLNIPLKAETATVNQSFTVMKGDKKYVLYANEIFMIKSAGAITISRDGVWDIKIKKSQSPVRVYIE